MSALLTQSIAAQALTTITPTIEIALKKFAKRNALYIVILDPSIAYDPTMVVHGSDRVFANEKIILAKLKFGDDTTWSKDYRRFALGKAAVSWRTQKDTMELQQQPHLYIPGEIIFPGGVCRDGIVAAASGVEAYFDHMFAEMATAACLALCRRQMEGLIISGLSHFPLS